MAKAIKEGQTHLLVGIEGNDLVIRIGLNTLAVAFELSESNHVWDQERRDFYQEFAVSDRRKFAQGVADALSYEDAEDGSTPLTRLIDEACNKAVENDMGVEECGRSADPSGQQEER